MPDEPLAELADLETRLRVAVGSLTDPDKADAEAKLLDASILVRDVADELEWTAADAPKRAIQIALEAARRAYINPDGLITERLGDASWGYHHGSLPGVYVTKQEAASLRKLGDSGFRAMTNVTPFNPEDDDDESSS